MPDDDRIASLYDRIASLYKGPLEEFTARRNELAEELPEAKKLKKPTRAAWLVNQLAARKAKQVGKLIAATEELRKVQEGLLSDPDKRVDLRKATEKRHKAIDSLMETASALGREHKASGQVLDRVEETLEAAVDPEVAEQIKVGRLEREQQRASIGFGAGDTAAPARKPRKKSKSAAQKERREEQAAERRREQAERHVRTAERKVERYRGAVATARDRLSKAEEELREARRAAED